MTELAFYGKGGIGKSTISANISAALAEKKHKVLQVGCDPKHDSTRLLLHGQRINTVLQYIKSTSPAKYRLEEIVFEGAYGIHCVEAGGPEPGVGCAGRGISQDNLFQTEYEGKIEELHIPYNNANRPADLQRIKPDILLTNYSSVDLDGDMLADTIPLCPPAGFLSGLILARRWGEFFRMNLKEGWKKDDFLFRKYYA